MYRGIEKIPPKENKGRGRRAVHTTKAEKGGVREEEQ